VKPLGLERRLRRFAKLTDDAALHQARAVLALEMGEPQNRSSGSPTIGRRPQIWAARSLWEASHPAGVLSDSGGSGWEKNAQDAGQTGG